MKAWLLTCAFLAATSGSTQQPFDWPVPAGWKKETIPFPLTFAPKLPYRGFEELRFAPSFFDPKSTNFWSYAFVWWLDGQPALTKPSFERDFVAYFAGLSTAVAAKKNFHLDPSRFKAVFAPDKPTNDSFTGYIDTYDAFITGQPIKL